MSYKVYIEVGKGEEKAISESTELSSKEDVSRWVKSHPFGNINTKIKIKDLSSGKIVSGKKVRFYNPERW